MRKIILAALLAPALASPVWAQSSVTLYGTLDIGVGQIFTDKAVGVRSSKFPSNWGIRGTEDLGGGLKAHFNLESGILSLDTGTIAGGGGFTRQSWIGLSGATWGDFLLGRTTTPQARLMSAFDLNGISDVNPWTTLGTPVNGGLGGSRYSDQLQYATPRMNGLQGRIAYSFDETQANTPAARAAHLQLGASYTQGRFYTALVVMPKSLAGKLDSVSSALYQTGFATGLKYDHGSFNLSMLYQRDEQKALGSNLALSAAVPFGALELGAQYAQVIKSTDSVYRGSKALELFANYKLSKRTVLYAIAAGVNSDAEQARKLLRKHSLSAGVLHRF